MSTMVAGHWLSVTSRDPRAIALYFRHYSSEKNGRRPSVYTSGFTGQGEEMVLLTERCDAVFAWVYSRVPRLDGQAGVNCSLFRNEGDTLSSDLIREADELAWARWPEVARHFTYVDSSKVRPKRDPGRCFLRAGWRDTRQRSGRGLLILEVER